ncbi:MAG: sodium ion-translocating decarboxylase subunit beta, partial [Kiritimatiellae bacterium]|nr:sodium ion-translocating decarboxylase subunit beta [Kiritimatiellia bacterium]
MKKTIMICAATLALWLAPATFFSAAAELPSGTKQTAEQDPDWRDTLEKVKGLAATTGIRGFMSKEAPEYLTKGYTTPEGAFVPGHEINVIGGLPYGVGQAVMIFICLGLIYLAVVKGFEPLLLLPIGFGGLLANMPYSGVTNPPVVDAVTKLVTEPGGFLYYFFDFGVSTGLFPIIIFMGVGAMTDFGPLIANPRTALLGAAAQFGIFIALFGALCLTEATGDFIKFGLKEAASIGIIGGADGPTAIWLTSKLAPHLLGAIAV